MAMPILIGAYLRRGRIVVGRSRSYMCDLIMRMSLLHEGLNTGGLANEVVSEGRVKWEKV
jgi:hypothetical protein